MGVMRSTVDVELGVWGTDHSQINANNGGELGRLLPLFDCYPNPSLILEYIQ